MIHVGRAESATPRFGRVLTAMVTPFADGGALDLDSARALARRLVDDEGNDGLVVNGTTGESPTTTDAEKADLLRVVVDEVGDRASVVAGVGTFSTDHTCELARQAADCGVDGLLVVTPYYSRPPQAGLLAHFEVVAAATDLPIMVYDIPHRSGVAIETATMVRLADLPTVVAVKDAKGDLGASSMVMSLSDLDYYSGDDPLTLPLLSIGAVGVVGTSTHFSAPAMKAMVGAYLSGDVALARQLHQQWLPVFTGVFAAQGVTMVKAALTALGQSAGPLRLPMVPPAEELVSGFLAALEVARAH
ncbi:4-hydroxy-tetrahydrodipicolinate synthase [Aestuariimicrobium kwangyangense]|uniref:4-hydroxy-tetrahydrodipicolinate synthase n=1 Tax=Aestuariimicrobium kwangyangense TaxID=396389 RepID=UPI0003B66FA2|nr:4-hydroxy-tetrahydrodipicolinate synthase [Aestuariimicrobium kwangyangense]